MKIAINQANGLDQIDYDADAYGKEVMVELIEFVRPEQKFENKEELKARVDKDIASGRQYFKI